MEVYFDAARIKVHALANFMVLIRVDKIGPSILLQVQYLISTVGDDQQPGARVTDQVVVGSVSNTIMKTKTLYKSEFQPTKIVTSATAGAQVTLWKPTYPFVLPKSGGEQIIWTPPYGQPVDVVKAQLDAKKLSHKMFTLGADPGDAGSGVCYISHGLLYSTAKLGLWGPVVVGSDVVHVSVAPPNWPLFSVPNLKIKSLNCSVSGAGYKYLDVKDKTFNIAAKLADGNPYELGEAGFHLFNFAKPMSGSASSKFVVLDIRPQHHEYIATPFDPSLTISVGLDLSWQFLPQWKPPWQ